MIPLRLTVKNFMCYRDEVPTLELGGIHVACLCGDNGHGKTALLDAITWALWGEARARTQDELVHQGQRDMMVELEFLARGQRYRVSRSHSRSVRSRQGSTILELQLVDGGIQPITGNSVRDTEARIRDLLHMDYDTFVSTAFLRQGDADRFTKSTPAKRKEHLAEVLDLSYYEALEGRARERSRSLKNKLLNTESAITVRQQEMGRKSEDEGRLAEMEADLERMMPETEDQRLRTEALRLAVASMQNRGGELEELMGRLEDNRRDLKGFQGQLQGHESRIAEYEAMLEEEGETRSRFAQLEHSRAHLERLNEALALKSTLDAQSAELDRAIAVQRERLSAKVSQLRDRADVLYERLEQLSGAEAGLVAMAEEQAELDQIGGVLQEKRSEAQEASVEIRYLEDTRAGLVREMEETRKKFDMLEGDDVVCPLCNQHLGREGQNHLRQEYEEQGQRSKQLHSYNTVQYGALQQSYDSIADGVSKLESDLGQRHRRVESRIAILERDRREAGEVDDDLRAVIEELKAAKARLDRDEFAPSERERMAKLKTKTRALNYDAVTHKTVRNEVNSLRRYDQLLARLDEARANLRHEREALQTVREIVQRRREEVGQAEERSVGLQSELRALPSMESQLRGAEGRYRELLELTSRAMASQSHLHSQMKRYDALEAEVIEQESKRIFLSDEKSLYDELVVAFGRNGIQALIIETAIPQLEADANELLARLTENRMSLRLQLLEGRKDRNSGLPAEELDIKIGDEVGTRSYETFSSGEAFRVDFALRIAMSKLLARRSGAPLPILFIDEGFGSQDVEGQERLTEAIQLIADDFQKVLVITHVEQIKESFPVRIEVTKSGSGSTFVVA